MQGTKKSNMRKVYVVDGARTPFLKTKGKPGPFSASDLAVQAGQEVLARQTFTAKDIDELILGCVMPGFDEANIARVVALRLGCGKSVPAWTVQRNCASGMQAIDSAVKDIASGRHHLVLAGGAEAMSHAPIAYNDKMVHWLSRFSAAKTFGAKLKAMSGFRPSYLKPVISLLRGLTDPVVNLNMGQTAENLAYRFNITREQMDEFSLESHQRVVRAQKEGLLKEINPVFTSHGQYYPKDDGVRDDTSLDKLAKLKPIFDKKFGNVTAGNSSQVTDGAAMLLLASEEAIEKYHLPVLAEIVDTEWAGLDPAQMGLGPVFAATSLLKRYELERQDIQYWEINEAFAAQVLACLAAWEDEEFCREHLGLDKAFGSIDRDVLNVDGGAVALGHPVGASGARIVLHMVDVLKRQKARLGVAAICIGGGQGGAMLIQNAAEV